MNTPLCQCGCSQPAPICTHTDKRAGLRKGEFRRFRRGHHFKLCTNNPATQKIDRTERFWNHVNKEGPIPIHRPDLGPCWIWTAATDKDGYGVIDEWRTHRLSYWMAFGIIPEGHLICHHCDNPGCIRPTHLFPGTQKQNIQDAVAKGHMRGRYVNRTSAA